MYSAQVILLNMDYNQALKSYYSGNYFYATTEKSKK